MFIIKSSELDRIKIKELLNHYIQETFSIIKKNYFLNQISFSENINKFYHRFIIEIIFFQAYKLR